jgi:hypothetical protein
VSKRCRTATIVTKKPARSTIIYTYDMWLDGVHASTCITTIVLEPSEDGDSSGTRLTFTEQGVHLDGVHGPGPQAATGRKEGTYEKTAGPDSSFAPSPASHCRAGGCRFFTIQKRRASKRLIVR